MSSTRAGILSTLRRAPGSARWSPNRDDWNRLRPPTLGDLIAMRAASVRRMEWAEVVVGGAVSGAVGGVITGFLTASAYTRRHSQRARTSGNNSPVAFTGDSGQAHAGTGDINIGAAKRATLVFYELPTGKSGQAELYIRHTGNTPALNASWTCEKATGMVLPEVDRLPDRIHPDQVIKVALIARAGGDDPGLVTVTWTDERGTGDSAALTI